MGSFSFLWLAGITHNCYFFPLSPPPPPPCTTTPAIQVCIARGQGLVDKWDKSLPLPQSGTNSRTMWSRNEQLWPPTPKKIPSTSGRRSLAVFSVLIKSSLSCPKSGSTLSPVTQDTTRHFLKGYLYGLPIFAACRVENMAEWYKVYMCLVPFFRPGHPNLF